jgi:hypothetical protein
VPKKRLMLLLESRDSLILISTASWFALPTLVRSLSGRAFTEKVLKRAWRVCMEELLVLWVYSLQVCQWNGQLSR